MKLEELIKIIKAKKVHQIRAGETHRFIDITIVETQKRFFVRQYKFGKKSWYDAFLEDPNGAIKCGNVIIPIKGIIPEDLEKITPLVNQAYRKKLGLIYPAMKLIFDTKKHEASTLELTPQNLEI